MIITKDQTFVMAGDSITESAAAHRPPATPPLDGPAEPLGYGYVTIVHSLLATAYPQLGIRVINAGRGGDTTPGLKARWQRDVLDLRPDWVSLMIGINDSDPWRQPITKHNLVSLDVYRAALDEIVAQTLPRVRGMILLTPFYLMTDRAHPYRSSVDEYVAAVKEIAARRGAILVDTQTPFDELLKTVPFESLSHDRVHPNQAGHTVIARGVCKAIGLEW
jgi:lysophospholipase L1-like esterase